ncbi:MAG: hypothetical protein ABI832_24330, partial [bacterium]
MGNQTYVLDWLVTGADEVSIFDDGGGTDKITVMGVYSDIVDLNLNYASTAGTSYRAGASYMGADSRMHSLYVSGVIENAYGSNGRDCIRGNELGNTLFGDTRAGGAGDSDTIWGGFGNDKVHGGAGGDLICGDEGGDRLYGDSGDDTVIGGSGADTIDGGAGADVLSGGGDAGDTLNYAKSGAAVRVMLTYDGATTGLGGDAEGDRIDGFVKLIGSRYADVLEDGDKDLLAGGANDNMFYGGNGADLLNMGGGNDKAFGGKGNDILSGESGNDILNGGGQNDHLHGGLGSDILKGGSGADIFEFWSADESRPGTTTHDVITDFHRDQGDVIDLHRIDADLGRGGNQPFHLV